MHLDSISRNLTKAARADGHRRRTRCLH